MKNLSKYLFVFFVLGLVASVNAQSLISKEQTTINMLFKEKGEIYFKFNIESRDEIAIVTKIISIDNVKDNVVFAYANKKGFEKFSLLHYSYTLLPNPSSLVDVKTINISSIKDLQLLSWNTYPSYSSYETIMNQFVTSYPSICKLVNIGTLSSGRKLLILKISDNINDKEDEPQFLYTSSIHGDETAGYVGMLNYIDYLLSNYGTNSRVTNLVNSMEIWINPLANPNGTYAGGSNSVNGATRYNGNYVDLNRNYPDPQAGQHPDGEVWQPETQAFMGFADTMHFVMSANFHGGAEVVNYPWDTWSALHADDNWWARVSKMYADTAHANSPNGYLTSVTQSGYTNGYAWYQITGGRQDYMNYFEHCREVTIEISNNKLLQSSQLLNNYNYNYRSWLNYMEEALHGIRGIVTDSCSGQPMLAKVFITGHDFTNSEVYSALPVGNYHRPIYQGTYNVTFSATGYQSKTINGISVTNGNVTVVNVSLSPSVLPALTASIASPDNVICQGESPVFNASVITGGPAASYQWQVNNNDAGTNSETFSANNFSDGDVVTCIINSSDVCVTGNPLTTNGIIVTVNPLPPTPVITQEFSFLTSNATSGNQWYNADTGIIDGETGTAFSPSSSGNYYVIVTDENGCNSDASNVIDFLYTGIHEINNQIFTVYPNPTNGDFTISWYDLVSNTVSIELFDASGNILLSKQGKGTTAMIDSGNLSAGIYFLRVTDESSSQVQKIIVEKK